MFLRLKECGRGRPELLQVGCKVTKKIVKNNKFGRINAILSEIRASIIDDHNAKGSITISIFFVRMCSDNRFFY